MEPSRSAQPFIARQGAAVGASVSVHRGEPVSLPPIYECLARPRHARHYIRPAYVLEAHVAEGYEGAVEMLTRTGHDDDFAPDASVYPKAPDPRTGERQLVKPAVTAGE